jgi:DNA-directed RNA polymerase subunit M/transcription elongation factor TFIIS
MEIEVYREKGIEALKTVLNKEQNVKTIEKVIFTHGENSEYLLNIYETIKDIKEGVKLNTLLTNIKKSQLGWKHSYLEDAIFEEIEQDNFIISPFEVEEGVLECKCGSKRVYSYSKQSRSADEPMSTYAQCMSCKNKWVYSG